MVFSLVGSVIKKTVCVQIQNEIFEKFFTKCSLTITDSALNLMKRGSSTAGISEIIINFFIGLSPV